MKLLAITALITLLFSCADSKAQNLAADMDPESDLEQLIGGWHGEMEGRLVFVRLDSTGVLKIELDGGIRDFNFIVKDFTSEKLVVKVIVEGRHYVSGPDLSNMNEEEAQKAMDELFSYELSYVLSRDSLSLTMGEETFLLKRCKEANCRGIKPDNMRFSVWAFKLELVRVNGPVWETVEEDKNDFLTIAKVVADMGGKVDGPAMIYSPGAPHLRIEDVEQLHDVSVDNGFNLLLDREVGLGEIEALLRSYRAAYPETKFYVVGVNEANATVRRPIDLSEFRDSNLDVSTWAAKN